MHKEIRDLVGKAALIGWTDTGELDGRGHHVLRHESGREWSIPATPSDHRSFRNTLADLERIAGRKLPRVKRSGMARRERRQRDRERAAEAERAAREEYAGRVRAAELRTEADEIFAACEKAQAAVRENPENPGARRYYDKLRAQLADLHRQMGEAS